MGWLIRYKGKKGEVEVPELGRMMVAEGETFDVAPSPEVRSAVRDEEQPWERILPGDDSYVRPQER